jgi:hypothetical protein
VTENHSDNPMSETQQQQATDERVPQSQHVLQNEENEDATVPLQQPPQPEAPAESEAKPDEPEVDEREELLRKERRAHANRVGQIVKQRYAEKARADALEQRLREIEQRQAQYDGSPQPAPTQEDIDRLIDQRAAEKLAIQQHNARVEEWDKAGKESFGEDKFKAACETVANMSSAEQRRMLLAIALDVEGGQRAIIEMADDPEEAERILAMPPHRMALALTKLGATPTPEPKPVSRLPPPIRPPSGGRARGQPDPEKGSWDEYKRWSSETNWRR